MESDMLKIGDFSKLAQVSVKALRYYGELGLLKPAWVDRFTGYRYYALDQLPRLNRILALKDLGFTLEQIQHLLQDDVSAAELRRMMRAKRAELEQLVQTEHARLVRVESRLQQIEQEGALPRYEVVLKTVAPLRVIGIRERLREPCDVDRLFEELRAYLVAQRAVPEPTHPYLAIYYDTEYHEGRIDAEAAVPLTKALRGTARAGVHRLPGFECIACVVHQGERTGLPQAYEGLLAWVEANGYRAIGPNREVYHQRLGSGAAGVDKRVGDWEHAPAGVRDGSPLPETLGPITEVQLPVEKNPVPTIFTGRKESRQVEPKIVSRPAFHVVGMHYRGKNEKGEIGQMWAEFTQRMDEIEHHISTGESFGVCSDIAPAEGLFEYVTGVEVSSAEDVPDGMVHWHVPANTYAVFTCTLPTIHETYRYAFETWLPQSGYKRADGPDFERYDLSFEPDEEGSELTIYIPIA
jgi:predicted transcriptional regulator YdeE/DNA-binding transcriptional MerR regulator